MVNDSNGDGVVSGGQRWKCETTGLLCVRDFVRLREPCNGGDRRR